MDLRDQLGHLASGSSSASAIHARILRRARPAAEAGSSFGPKLEFDRVLRGFKGLRLRGVQLATKAGHCGDFVQPALVGLPLRFEGVAGRNASEQKGAPEAVPTGWVAAPLTERGVGVCLQPSRKPRCSVKEGFGAAQETGGDARGVKRRLSLTAWQSRSRILWVD
jgi:hypothetical protein